MSSFHLIIKTITIVLSPFLLLAACTKEEPAYLDKYVGSYTVKEIYWTGPFAYLDGDSIGRKDLMEEFDGCPGYVENLVKAKVEKLDEGRLRYTANVPVYVSDPETGNGVVIYYEAQFDAKWNGTKGSQVITAEDYYPKLSEGLVGANSISLDCSNISSDSFEIRVYCSLPDKDKNLNKGYMYLSFKKD